MPSDQPVITMSPELAAMGAAVKDLGGGMIQVVVASPARQPGMAAILSVPVPPHGKARRRIDRAMRALCAAGVLFDAP